VKFDKTPLLRAYSQVLDVSEAAGALDLKPSRLSCMLQGARDFVRNFFDQVHARGLYLWRKHSEHQQSVLALLLLVCAML